ncbi:hypothetical protein ACC772_39495, partial [Rhizobium ruizarguesonis]
MVAIGRPIVSTTACPLGMQIQVEYVFVSEGSYRVQIFWTRVLSNILSIRSAFTRSGQPESRAGIGKRHQFGGRAG